MRKLATIRKISEIKPIDGADAIELAVVDGWQSVIKKGEFQVGELAVYCEVDSWIPTELAPFLSKGKEPKVFEGTKGERLRSIKLRGTLSQGLILKVQTGIGGFNFIKDKDGETILVDEGKDVTDILGILKWEKPIPAQLRGQVLGNFPVEIPKTDQERIQNLVKDLESIKSRTYQVTEKLHGSSCTFYLDTQGVFHVCSRNLDLKFDENNAYWKAAIQYDIEAKMNHHNLLGVALQGELIGQGINGNQYEVLLEFHLFDAFGTGFNSYFIPSSTSSIANLLEIPHVPILQNYFVIPEHFGVKELLEFAEGKSFLNQSEREGLVFKDSQSDFSFKVVSNKWLIDTGE